MDSIEQWLDVDDVSVAYLYTYSWMIVLRDYLVFGVKANSIQEQA